MTYIPIVDKMGHSMVNDFGIKMMIKKGAIEIVFKSLELFRIYQLIQPYMSEIWA